MEDWRLACRLVGEGRVLQRIVGKRKGISMTLADAGQVGLNADTILRTIPVLLATAGAVYKFKDARPRRRTNLKADLELLRAAREQRIECDDFRASIEKELSRLYRSSGQREWYTVAFGSVLALLFGIWTVYLVSDGSWWAVGTGFCTFVGISLATAGLDAAEPTESGGADQQRRPTHAYAVTETHAPQ
jgi:hypothetical protein